MTAWLHGLCVDSGIPLPCLAAPGAAPVDLIVTDVVETGPFLGFGTSPGPENDQTDAGVLDAGAPADSADRRLLFRDHQLEVWESLDGAKRWARYPRFGLLFELVEHDGQTSISTFAHDPGDWQAWVPVLAQGAVVTTAVALSGRAAFHANTLDVSGRGLLIGGVSGAGKTVASALLSLAGHTLVADDVSVVDPGLPVRPGLLELRIRTWENPLGEALVEQLASLKGTTVRDTVDWRVAVRLAIDPRTEGVVPRHMLLPMIDPAVSQPQLVRLSGAKAVTALLPVMRLVGWIDPARQRADFGHCADLAERVGVHRLVLPQLAADDPIGIVRTVEQLDGLVGTI